MADKAKVCTKTYIDGEGAESRHASPDAETLRFDFATGESFTVNLASFPKNVLEACAWHGMSQKLGDAFAGKSGSDAVENFETLLERLTGGEWVKAREGAGPRPSMVVDAIVAALVASGEEVDDERRAKIKEKVSDQEARKAALANPAIKAEYEAIRAKHAAAKAKAAKDAAKGADEELRAAVVANY